MVQWKAWKPYREKAIGDFNDNPERKVEIAMEQVQQTNAVVEKLERLRDIKGIGLPTATAVLTFTSPRAYTVLDVKAWTALNAAGHLYTEPKDAWSSGDYLQYLGVCHALASELEVGLKTLDQALWILGGK